MPPYGVTETKSINKNIYFYSIAEVGAIINRPQQGYAEHQDNEVFNAVKRRYDGGDRL